MKQIILMLTIAQVFTGYGYAQSGDTLPGFVDNAASNNIRSRLSSPFGAGSLPNLHSNVSLSSYFEQGVNGKLELQGKFSSRWSGGITIDQKIGKSDKVAVPLDLSGISPGTTIRLNVQKMCWRPSFQLSDAEVIKLNKATDQYEVRKGLARRTAGLREINMDGTDEEKKMALEALNSVSFRLPLIINADVGFTKTAFSYATDSFTLKENRASFMTPTATVSLVKAIGRGFNVLGYAALSYNYSESYNAGGDVNFMLPFGRTPYYYTGTLTFGAPVKSKNHNLTGEFRRNIFLRNNTNIAISPSVTYGLNTDNLGVFLPVYLIRGADKEGKMLQGLQGGVRFGYITNTRSGQGTSFKDGFIAQLIISQPLTFLDRL
jgi:hypothetical protein